MLMTLSPQGVAKINSDVTRGVACQETLADLQAAFDLRNDPTFQSNQAAVRLSQRLKRELSASELNVLGDHADLLQASSPAHMEADLEDKVSTYLIEQVRETANELQGIGVPIEFTPLVVTARPRSSYCLTASGATNFFRGGVNPASTWFESKPLVADLRHWEEKKWFG
eukprot:TRINITY_DN8868_c0_g1_i1.p1 TRINITY_DN8868_c0_g1~~TRINITY_DN8868_c0_g1_i1.p1  ORF type:complete len:169 (-),score=17.85 TRINITY_DN8868_c0_g1_i1:232-738(-)